MIVMFNFLFTAGSLLAATLICGFVLVALIIAAPILAVLLGLIIGLPLLAHLLNRPGDSLHPRK